ncbi:MAG TPA: HU family DNA-binding protein [Burkholderiales bacterium]|nr:HU family DNA-binding protein [Burkholderiales bacterium]
MNKSQLIEAIADKADISKVKAGDAIDAFIGAVTHALKGGDVVTLIGFGSFSTAKRAARVGRNPKTGKEIKIAATTTPKFKAGKALKEAVSKKKK